MKDSLHLPWSKKSGNGRTLESGAVGGPRSFRIPDIHEFYANVVESSENAIIGKTLDGIVFSWNTGAERLYGFLRNEIIGHSISRIVPPERAVELRCIVDQIRLGNTVDGLETVRVRKNRERVQVSLTIAPIRNAVGEIVGASSIARDITARLRTQEAEREAFTRLRAVVETAVDGIITIDEFGIIESVNPTALRMFGFHRSELIGANVMVLMPEPYRREHDSYLANYLRTGIAKVIGVGREVRGRRKDGSEFPMELAVSQTHIRGRRMFTGIVRDVSRRRAAEQALRESEARFRLMANTAPSLIWMSGVDKACTWFNKRWLEFTGRTMEEELGDGWTQGLHAEDREHCIQAFHTAFDARMPFEVEFRLRHRDGEFRWVCNAGVPIRLEDGSFAGYIGSCVDVTDRKLGEETLLGRVKQRTQELTTANEQLQHQITERRRVELLLATENRILELIATGAGVDHLLNALCESIERLIPNSWCAIRLGTGHNGLESQASPESNSAITVGLDVFGAIAEKGVYPPLCRERTVVPDGSSRPEEASCQLHVQSYWLEPIVAPGGAVVGTLGIYSLEAPGPDENALSAAAMAARLAGIIVERARSETQAREQLAQLAHVARLATMGEMASGLAHELNQPLCAIVNFTEACAELVPRSAPDGKQICQALREVTRQAERAGEVIRRLRDFVKRKEPERKPVDINRIIREVIAFTAMESRHSEVRIRAKLAKGIPKVFADSIQIEQVLVNLVRNGFEAMRDGGQRGKELIVQTVRRKGAVEVMVIDCGPGIADWINERLFEPFFTTKPNGLGLGLSITRSILEVHEGRLWVTTKPKGGTTFHFTIPTAWRIRHARRNRVCDR